MNGCGWNIKRSGWNFGVELHQLSLPYIMILKSFVVNFLDKKLSRFFIKLLSRFFRRLLFNFFFVVVVVVFFFKNNVFGCKFRAAFATTSRRPLRNAVIPARDGNAKLIMKKSSCLLYVRLQSFHDNTELIMNSSCMSFRKLPRHPL